MRQNPGHITMSRTSPVPDVGAPIALTPKREHGVGTNLEVTGHPTREVHAKERVARIGDRIDEPTDEVALVRLHCHVLATERDDPGTGLAVGLLRDAIGV